MARTVSILGSTGSIGRQAREVCAHLGLRVAALAAHHSVQLLEEQARRFHPAQVAVVDRTAAADLKIRLADTGIRVQAGEEALIEAACCETADTVLNAVVGIAGLLPTVAAIEAGKDIALANKETLVAGGHLVMPMAARHEVRMLPVDSEHSAIFQCLQGHTDAAAIERILLTASGGPFFGRTRAELAAVTPAMALRHPTWQMGAKITIDSSTLMNKGLELIEARWLFDVRPDQIEIVVNRESILHSAVAFVDGAVIAQLGLPDMKLPIQYALTWPDRLPMDGGRLSLAQLGTLSFARPDEETFRCLPLCREAIRRGGGYPCVANGANEEAVALFLAGKLRYLEIAERIEEAMARWPDEPVDTVEAVLAADAFARRVVRAARA